MASPFPTTRAAGCPFDPPVELAKLRAEHPLSPMTFADGHVGWLVTSHALVRAVLADKRFSARAELAHPVLPGVGGNDGRPAARGAFIRNDPPEHTRYRHLVTGRFTVRRMRLLTDWITELTKRRLDLMERHGPPVDLVEMFAQPIPAQVIFELLGIPHDQHDELLHASAPLSRLDATPEEKLAAFTTLNTAVRDQVVAKRTHPGDDMLSELTATDLDDDELTTMGFLLLGGGTDTTANMLGLGVFALLQHPDQLAAMLREPERTEHAVEELLRYLSIIPGTIRTALEDVELGGVVIEAGQSVMVSIPAANRDPERFPHPDELDLHRPTGGHLAFGHGVHQCIGQQLARVEMQVAFPALFARFPTLRLAVRPEEVTVKDDMLIYGVHRLPVTWDV
ncbi:cytochrome P450 [Pseudonocardia sp. TRM90224]|uniref:cytochrome P450 n=1 Tax=Pseudonocardia sp. TRM90224 TaxID=2812678 RepID=UPI001E3A2883|nr:cytochrome P450 [Pseudonocardia sp. TRM90224]